MSPRKLDIDLPHLGPVSNSGQNVNSNMPQLVDGKMDRLIGLPQLTGRVRPILTGGLVRHYLTVRINLTSLSQ